jgi:hypothetical protein
LRLAPGLDEQDVARDLRQRLHLGRQRVLHCRPGYIEQSQVGILSRLNSEYEFLSELNSKPRQQLAYRSFCLFISYGVSMAKLCKIKHKNAEKSTILSQLI